MGPGIFGVAAAADYYFGKRLKDLSLEECAMIAGLPRNPSIYSPRQHPATALVRRNFALDRMAAEHMISKKLAEEAKLRPIALKPIARDDRDIAPHFVEWVRESLATRYSTDEIWRKGMRVYTTLNIRMQNGRNALRGTQRLHKRGWRAYRNVFETPAANLRLFPSCGAILRLDYRRRAEGTERQKPLFELADITAHRAKESIPWQISGKFQTEILF
jgi:membrane carboxypeptidase/penicillin-binding protein